ncbi:MAG: hypothetical protein KA746_02560 [Pyrinomonadaceae bacterium]|nr:hypothetical protein [Pyrinomonadaceae bacterium]MBP6212347.1 hypothetical protein [Pyrinomonadaceae bacterium]
MSHAISQYRLLLAVSLFISSLFYGCAKTTVNENLPQTDAPSPSSSPTVAADSADVEDFFKVFGDPRYRTGHTWKRRTPEADTMGRLSEIADEHARGPVSTFYISPKQMDDTDPSKIQGYDPSIDYSYIYAYWKEENSILILYPPYNVEDVTYLSWAWDLRRYDLSRDVKKETDPTWGQSSITPEGAKELLRLCMDKGVKIVIDKSRSERNTKKESK